VPVLDLVQFKLPPVSKNTFCSRFFPSSLDYSYVSTSSASRNFVHPDSVLFVFGRSPLEPVMSSSRRAHSGSALPLKVFTHLDALLSAPDLALLTLLLTLQSSACLAVLLPASGFSHPSSLLLVLNMVCVKLPLLARNRARLALQLSVLDCASTDPLLTVHGMAYLGALMVTCRIATSGSFPAVLKHVHSSMPLLLRSPFWMNSVPAASGCAHLDLSLVSRSPKYPGSAPILEGCACLRLFTSVCDLSNPSFLPATQRTVHPEVLLLAFQAVQFKSQLPASNFVYSSSAMTLQSRI